MSRSTSFDTQRAVVIKAIMLSEGPITAVTTVQAVHVVPRSLPRGNLTQAVTARIADSHDLGTRIKFV